MQKEKFDPFAAEWMSFANSEKYNLIEKCLKLAQLLEYPDLDITQYIQKINDIGKSLKVSITEIKNPTYLISMLNEHLFDTLEFVGNQDDYYNPKNNFLNEVLDKKTGIPITMSIIYSEVAKHIGLNLKIVGFPSHVLVKFNEEMILDPFDGGDLLDVEKLQGILNLNYGGHVEFIPEYLNEIKDNQILMRVIRNLKNSYVQSFAYDKAMRCTNMILAIEPHSPEDIRDKGILEDRQNNSETALKFLNQYLELSPNAEDVDIILELIKSIKEKSIND